MIGVIGAGAFGTALAVALSREGRDVVLWGRAGMEQIALDRQTPNLPGVSFPETLKIAKDLAGLATCETLLLATPMQALSSILPEVCTLPARHAVACCKGVDLTALVGPSQIIADGWANVTPAVLSGPSFAHDIATGLPTALSLACADAKTGASLQTLLSTQTLRLYRTTDVTGVELGGALKNVIAIACGTAIGAGLGESARAALMTRGFAEIQRLACHLGAEEDTLQGLSGFGDLVLTCTSAQSRNYAFGLALGAGTDPAKSTVEGRATAQAVARLADQHSIDMPITQATAALVTGTSTVENAIQTLLGRSLKQE